MKALREYSVLFPVSLVALLALVAVSFCYGARPAEFWVIIIGGLSMTGALLFAFMGLVVLWFLISAFCKGWRYGYSRAQSMALFNHSVDQFFTWDRIWPGLIGAAVYYAIGIMIAVGKSLIPYVSEYHLDPALAELDRAIHGNVYPDRILVPLVLRFDLYDFFNFTYLLWFHVKFGAIACALFCDGDVSRRMRFLWASLILWLGAGILGAMALSSVGPIYYGIFYPELENPYAGLLQTLRDVHSTTELNVMKVAGILLEFARNDQVVDLNGISAMPSMHVAIVSLITCYAFSWSRRAGILCALYTLLIMLGSVILGWHYAVDGYVAVILAVAVWFVTGLFVKPKASPSARTAEIGPTP